MRPRIQVRSRVTPVGTRQVAVGTHHGAVFADPWALFITETVLHARSGRVGAVVLMPRHRAVLARSSVRITSEIVILDC